ncbi:carboxypeptidase N subunit 2-like isoform X2 [Leptidea sinapis]|uniref:carboxypeptidase N subunit 2-like isoform X2 n=1 Tax=Leptidea sinapis TaxID=189913 RepID=UPI0021C4918F|nr:carboxypeptidase N subunit 2-like isoform X2 [Leptidea sinapis]
MVFGDGCKRHMLRLAIVATCLLAQVVAPGGLEPCSGSPLCTCRAAHMSCTAVPLHRFPEWPQIDLQHLDISMSYLEVITESSLDGLRLQTLVLVANRIHYIESHALSSMSSSLASLDLGYNEFTEIPEEGLKDLRVLNWLNLQKTLKNQLHGIDARKIRYLEIKGSNLERISEDAFEPFANSQEIFVKITETSISKLPATFMKHLGQIPQLGIDISYNQIARLNPAIFYPNFTSWSHVATKLLSGGLIMTGNPLRCECDLAWLGAWLRRWLQENDAGNELRRAMRSATCRDQLGRHLPLLQLRADEAECHASALSSDAQPNFINFVYTITYSIWVIVLR